MPSLSERLKKSRKIAGKTQTQIADAVGISQANYQSLETGKNKKSAFLPQIANILGVDVNWLITGELQTQENNNGDNFQNSDDISIDKSSIINNTNTTNNNYYTNNNEETSSLNDVTLTLYHHANAPTKSRVDLGEYIIDKFHGIQRKNLFIVPIIDDEMYPVLKRGSIAVADSGKSGLSILAGYIYVIRHGNTLHCRYLEEYSDTQIRIYTEKDKAGEIIEKNEFREKYKIKGGILLSTEFHHWF